MLSSWPIALCVGSILGFLSGLGVGGGSLLILWLTLVLGMDQPSARGLNLLFFLPAALVAITFRWKQGCIKIRAILPAVIGGCVCAALFSRIGQGLDLEILKKLFGGLLLITGLRELCWKPKKKLSAS